MGPTFIRSSDLSAEERNERIESGELQPWRRDGDGELWFKTKAFPTIYGTPQNRGPVNVVADSLTESELEELDEVGTVHLNGRGLYESWRTDASGRKWLKRVDANEAALQLAADDEDDPLEALAAEAEAERERDRERAVRRFSMLAISRARGIDIPPHIGSEVLEAAGRTMDDWNEAVAEAQQLLIDCGEL